MTGNIQRKKASVRHDGDAYTDMTTLACAPTRRQRPQGA